VHEVDGVLKQRDLHWAMVAGRPSTALACLLRRLAEQNGDSLVLAPYRAGGIAYLLTVLEDEHRGTDDRVLSAIRLGQVGTVDLLERMASLAGDAHTYYGLYGGHAGPGEPDETLGWFVQRAMRDIRRRASR
jgi:hypothetical protein